MKLFTIPNIITLMNLLCGCLAIVFAFNGDLVWSAYLVGIAAVLDFLDGFVARALKQYSAIGKDLDSLADMVTFGVVPGVVMFQMMRHAFSEHETNLAWGTNRVDAYFDPLHYPLAFLAFLIPLFSALRLAKFNNDTRQTDSFIGVPTPANSILICSLPLIWEQTKYSGMTGDALNSILLHKDYSAFDHFCFSLITNPWVLTSITAVMCFLLIAEIPLFALKVKGFGWNENKIRYIFLALAVLMLIVLKFVALPLIIVLYVLMSVGNNAVGKK